MLILNRGNAVDELKRQGTIAYLRGRMREFGIKPDDLAAALAADQVKQSSARYRNSSGETWDGTGDMPLWLRQAVSAGQTPAHFETARMQLSPESVQTGVDWSKDPFAGSRLARN